MAEPAPVPSVPVEAAKVFGVGLALAERYAGWLADAGIVRGLLGPREAERIWDRHLINSALLAGLVPQNASVVDLGSGAGLPGIPLALARPDLRVTLVEPLLRRATFLDEVVADLATVDPSLTQRLKVVRSRAEDLAPVKNRRNAKEGASVGPFDVVTSRALAPLERLLTWSIPLVGRGGAVLALKGSSAQREIDEAAKALAKAGVVAEVVEVVDPAGAITVVRVRRGSK